MTKNRALSISKENRKAIVATAATLKEASDHLYKLASSKTTDQVDAQWLIRQTYITLRKVMKLFNIDT